MATQLDSVELEAIPVPAVVEPAESGLATAAVATRHDEAHVAQGDAHDDLDVGDDPWALGLDWPVVAWIVIVHLGALAAPFVFTWKAWPSVRC